MGERVYAQVYDDNNLIGTCFVGKLNYYLDFEDMKSNLVLLNIAMDKVDKGEITEEKLSEILMTLRAWQWSTGWELDEAGDFKFDYFDFLRYLEAAAEDKLYRFYNEAERKQILEQRSEDEWKIAWIEDSLKVESGRKYIDVDLTKCKFALYQGA